MYNTFPNFNLLTTLKVLLEERHVTLTAHRLCLTQPTVSKRLNQLRELFRDPLLVRVGNTLEPTSFAISLLPRLEHLFNEANSLIYTSKFDPQRDELNINLAITDFSLQIITPKILCTLINECPHLRITVHEWQRIHITDLLLGKVHFAKCHFVTGELSENFHAVCLHSRIPVCLMRRGHPLEHSKMTMNDFLCANHISYLYEHDSPNWLDETLAQMGVKRNIVIRYPSVRGGLLIVQHSDLIMSTSQEVANEYAESFNLVARKLPLNLPSSPEYFIWHDRYEHDPGHKWFRNRFLYLYKETADLPCE